jgi:hypothetical protein
VKRIVGVVLLMMMALAGCTQETPSITPTPLEPGSLLKTVIANLQQLKTFRMLIEQQGVPYTFRVTLDQGVSEVVAEMRRAEAQYENPNILYADTRLSLGGLPPIGVEIFARGADQWFKLLGTDWIKYPIAEGFDPGKLIQEDSGFPAALSKLQEMVFIGEETLDTGEVVFHVQGRAQGQVINDLMFGLLEVAQEVVNVDVYVEKATLLPALLIVTLPNTATADNPKDTAWRIEVYGINETPDGKGPAITDATAEAAVTTEALATAETTSQP